MHASICDLMAQVSQGYAQFSQSLKRWILEAVNRSWLELTKMSRVVKSHLPQPEIQFSSFGEYRAAFTFSSAMYWQSEAALPTLYSSHAALGDGLKVAVGA